MKLSEFRNERCGNPELDSDYFIGRRSLLVWQKRGREFILLKSSYG